MGSGPSYETGGWCGIEPGYHDEVQGFSYALWGDLWAGYEPDRRELRRAVDEEIDRDWSPGDVIRIVLQRGITAIGQILWVDPRNYRIHISAQATFTPTSDPLTWNKPVRPDLIIRTFDALLVHRIWTKIGHADLPSNLEPFDVIARDSSGQIVTVDPVTQISQGPRDADSDRACVPEWSSPQSLRAALEKLAAGEPLPHYYEDLRTRRLDDLLSSSLDSSHVIFPAR
ncbi:hypothetical protein MN032_11900 [Agromyces atrinae]|uniref:hypothetical protein n=1 Tax=Agromyces atrinae TaxID=592376 RepID=UPI001F57495C|nr:hypothetical protein [Agromyces atrinae]MCI2958397.1 hypothetical protein [Agromyces atrinae]